MLSGHAIAALSAVERGWAVFPCKVDKSPYTPHGFKDATTDRQQIALWWKQWERASIGIATGARSGIVVLDVDPRSGGEESLATLQSRSPLPPTMTVQTGGGGWHYYFLLPPGMTIASGAHVLGQGLDVKAEGGYVIGPGSDHPSGAQYLIRDPSPIAPLPHGLVTLLAKPHRVETNGAPAGSLTAIHDGVRNATLASLAGSMRRRGMTRTAIETALLVENQERCSPPLPLTEVQHIAASIARYPPAVSPSLEAPELGALSLLPYHFTDEGNAERLYARTGEQIRWIQQWKKWVAWEPPRWDPDGQLSVQRYAKATIRALYREAGTLLQQASAIEDETQRQAHAKKAAPALKHALASEAHNKIDAMMGLLKEKVATTPEVFDANPWLLNCTNGIIDLRTGTLSPHDRDHYCTKLVPIDFDEDAPCVQWEAFLESIFDGKQELIDWLQKAIGYTLTGSIQEQVFFLCHGVGSNGKSTMLHILGRLTGEYGMTTPFQTFVPQRSETIRNDLAALRGTRFVSAIESSVGGRLSESVLKSVTGGDILTARFLHGEFFSFAPQFKVWLASNHKPVIKDTSNGMWRRVCLIPYTVVIDDEKQDHLLWDKLHAELSGILAWAVRGSVRWQAEGLKPFPDSVIFATETYREESDMVMEFLAEECILQAGMTTPSSLLYSSFCRWSEQQGEKKPLSINAFGAALTEKGFIVERSKLTGRKLRKGIGLRIQPEENS